jgi:hypothetical protein
MAYEDRPDFEGTLTETPALLRTAVRSSSLTIRVATFPEIEHHLRYVGSVIDTYEPEELEKTVAEFPTTAQYQSRGLKTILELLL